MIKREGEWKALERVDEREKRERERKIVKVGERLTQESSSLSFSLAL